jgi:AAA15 family ATPase/GTPase
MIIEFSVSNFFSIRDKQTLSMVASRDSNLPENTIPVSLPGFTDVALLKSAIFYGANASGKSNFLSAFTFMKGFIENSASSVKPGERIPFEPFLLDSFSRDTLSEFEITFILDGIRYQYGFAVDTQRVHSEWLYAYPKGQPQKWFQRDFENGAYSWDFSQKHFRGGKDSLKAQTRDNALFLSVAAQFNHEQLSPIYGWFSQKIISLDLIDLMSGLETRAATFFEKHPELKNHVMSLLQSADWGISETRLREENVLSALPEDIPPSLKEHFKDKKIRYIDWIYKSPKTKEEFAIRKQSSGTLRFYSALGPLLDAFSKGGTFIVDELGANLHPLLMRALLHMIHDEKENPKNAQVILTTHDSTLLDKEVFRRDQIWFTEKDNDFATRLYPLTDFNPRQGEAIARGYLAGRYGAIPCLSGELAI